MRAMWDQEAVESGRSFAHPPIHPSIEGRGSGPGLPFRGQKRVCATDSGFLDRQAVVMRPF